MAGSGSLACHLMSNKEFITATSVMISANSFTCLACIIAIFLIIFLKDYNRFLIRLLLYLNLSAFFFMFAEIMENLPLKSEDGMLVVHNKVFCAAVGFFGVLFGSLFLLAMFFVALHLLLLTTAKNKKNLHNRAREIGGVITAVTVAIIMATIPLIPFDGDTAYGIIGIFCWIEQNPVCGNSTVGIINLIFLWHIPLLVVSAFMICALVIAAKVLNKKPSNDMQPTEQEQYTKARKEGQTLTVYVIIFISLNTLNFVIILMYAFSEEHHKIRVFELVSLVVRPLLLLSVPAAYIFHPGTRKKLRYSRMKQAINKWKGEDDAEVYTNYVVPQEFSDCDDLVITGSDRHNISASQQFALEQINIQGTSLKQPLLCSSSAH